MRACRTPDRQQFRPVKFMYSSFAIINDAARRFFNSLPDRIFTAGWASPSDNHISLHESSNHWCAAPPLARSIGHGSRDACRWRQRTRARTFRRSGSGECPGTRSGLEPRGIARAGPAGAGAAAFSPGQFPEGDRRCGCIRFIVAFDLHFVLPASLEVRAKAADGLRDESMAGNYRKRLAALRERRGPA